MKDYRVKEVVSKSCIYFQIQRYSWFSGWYDASHRIDDCDYVHSTLEKAQSHIQEIRDRETTEVKYHY